MSQVYQGRGEIRWGEIRWGEIRWGEIRWGDWRYKYERWNEDEGDGKGSHHLPVT